MAGYTLARILIKNYKYIPYDRPLKVEFNNSNIVILSGPNGYGKTTLFDAIELLISGSIMHFNANLPNRGSEGIDTLAHDKRNDIFIKGTLFGPNNEIVEVERCFDKDQGFQSKLFWNQNETTQEELYSNLKTSNNMFNIGTYISQSESLTFLQNKYKSRKEQVSNLLDNPEIPKRIELLVEVENTLKSRIEGRLSGLKSSHDSAIDKVETLKKHVENVKKPTALLGENIRLFPEKEYDFDLVEIDSDKSYEEYVLPLSQIEAFIKNYDEYRKYISNAYTRRLLETPANVYMALFFKRQVEILRISQNKLELISKCTKLLEQFKQNSWSVNPKLFSYVGISNDIAEKATRLITDQQNEQKKMNDSDNAIYQMMQTRKSFIKQFNFAVQHNTVENNTCPLCGTKFDEISKAFSTTEKVLNNVRDEAIDRVKTIEEQLHELFENDIIPAFEKIIGNNRSLMELNNLLSPCINLSCDELINDLKMLNIDLFSSKLSGTVFDLQEFEREYNLLQSKIKQKYRPNKSNISNASIELFKSIHFEYYNNQQPSHTIEQIQKKRQYIAGKYLDQYSLKLSEAQKELDELKSNFQKYKNKSERMMDTIHNLIGKYQEAQKYYQTLLANAIRVPLMIYSGKIIQNYPLGLGIKAVIRTNQLVFETSEKNGFDVYNSLSTGQLNGLAIAILLSVRNIYGYPNGLDILMIDDPLQTIDDISAISLSDLLTKQAIGQIIISTHEDRKANLFRFKFKQANLSVCEYKMQQIYLTLKN